MNMRIRQGIVLMSLWAVARASGAEVAPVPTPSDPSASVRTPACAICAASAGDHSLATYLAGRVRIGTRSTAFSLDQTESKGVNREKGETFLGNIARIEEEQNYAPTRVHLDVLILPWMGVELAWDGVEARTWNANNGESDGIVCAEGPTLSLLGQYPNRSRLTPFAALGYTFWEADFEEEAWWHYGFNDEAEYVAAGCPGRSRSHLERYMTTDIDNGVVLTAGLIIRIGGHLSADLLVRQTDVAVDARYYRCHNGSTTLDRTGEFPLEHIAYGGGLQYVF